jgi:peptidoglycan DL-endopeptidase CwlO
MMRLNFHFRRFVAALLAGLVSVSVTAEVIMSPAASAQSVDDQSRKVARLADQLERLEEQIDRYAEDYAAALDEQSRLVDEIEVTTARVGELEAQLAELQGDLASVAIAAFVTGGAGGTLTSLLTSTGGITDAVQRQHLTRVALDAGVVDADDLAALAGRLAAERRSLERAQQRMTALAQTAEAAQRTAETQQAEYRQQFQQAKNELGQLIVAERARRERVRLAEAQRQAEANRRTRQAAAVAAATTPSTNSRSAAARAVALPTVPPPSTKAGIVVNAALAQLGVPYRFAKSVPGVAFDCSGLTKYAWGMAGVHLPHQSRQQFSTTSRIPKEYAQAGDLIYYYSPISHVGIYLGDGRLVHAPATGDVVKISAVNWGRVAGVTRPG